MGDSDSGAGDFVTDVIATDGEALHLPGVSNNYASVPDAADLDGFTDFTFEMKGVTFADWTSPATYQGLMSKYETSGNERAWQFLLRTDGKLDLVLSFNGSTYSSYTSSEVTGVTDGATADIMAMRNGEDVRFYVDGVQLGTDQTCVTTALHNSTEDVVIGAGYNTTTYPMTGSMERVRIWNSAVANQATPTETPVLDMNFTLANKGVTSFTATSGQEVTIHSTAIANPAAIRSATDGVLVNGPTFVVDNPPNYSNYSMHFDATDDYITSGYTFPTGDADKSFSLWFNLDSSQYAWLIAGGADTDSNAFGLYVNGTTLSFHGNGGTYDMALAGTTFATGTWYHVAVTYDGTNIRGYVNGILDTTKSAALVTSSATIRLGVRQNGSHFFDGFLDEVAVWNSVLTSAQINDIYNGGVPAALTSLSPIGWWRFGENDSGAGTTISDEGSGGNDGTLVSTPTFERSVPAEDATWNNRSLTFDGVDQHMTTTADDTLASKSYSFWAKSGATDVDATNPLFSHGADYAGTFLFNYASSEALLTMGTARYVRFADNSAQDDDAWHHHVVYIEKDDMTACKWYVDGVVQAHSSSGNTGAYRAYEGISIARVNDKYFDGELDEFAVFDGELTPAQVLQIYNGGSPADLKEFSPESWWRMGDDDDAGGTTITDLAAIVGSEAITNGNFAADSDWVKGDGWTISGGTANSDGSQSGNSNLKQVAGLDTNAAILYEVTFTVSNRSAGSVRTIVGGSAIGTYRSANGTYIEVLGITGGSNFFIQSDTDFVGSIDNVSVKQINGNPGTLVNTPTFSTDTP
jgi:hypothetical protein